MSRSDAKYGSCLVTPFIRFLMVASNPYAWWHGRAEARLVERIHKMQRTADLMNDRVVSAETSCADLSRSADRATNRLERIGFLRERSRQRRRLGLVRKIHQNITVCIEQMETIQWAGDLQEDMKETAGLIAGGMSEKQIKKWDDIMGSLQGNFENMDSFRDVISDPLDSADAMIDDDELLREYDAERMDNTAEASYDDFINSEKRAADSTTYAQYEAQQSQNAAHPQSPDGMTTVLEHNTQAAAAGVAGQNDADRVRQVNIDGEVLE